MMFRARYCARNFTTSFLRRFPPPTHVPVLRCSTRQAVTSPIPNAINTSIETPEEPISADAPQWTEKHFEDLAHAIRTQNEQEIRKQMSTLMSDSSPKSRKLPLVAQRLQQGRIAAEELIAEMSTSSEAESEIMSPTRDLTDRETMVSMAALIAICFDSPDLSALLLLCTKLPPLPWKIFSVSLTFPLDVLTLWSLQAYFSTHPQALKRANLSSRLIKQFLAINQIDCALNIFRLDPALPSTTAVAILRVLRNSGKDTSELIDFLVKKENLCPLDRDILCTTLIKLGRDDDLETLLASALGSTSHLFKSRKAFGLVVSHLKKKKRTDLLAAIWSHSYRFSRHVLLQGQVVLSFVLALSGPRYRNEFAQITEYVPHMPISTRRDWKVAMRAYRKTNPGEVIPEKIRQVGTLFKPASD